MVTIHVDHPPNIGGRSASLQKPCARRHGRDHRTPAQRRRPKCFWATAGGSGNEKGPVMLRLVKFRTKRVQKRGPFMDKNIKKMCSCFGSTLFFGGLTVDNHRRSHFHPFSLFAPAVFMVKILVPNGRGIPRATWFGCPGYDYW